MKDLIKLSFFLALLIGIWLFPVIISFATWNFWYILLYAVWWYPAMILTGLISAVVDHI